MKILTKKDQEKILAALFESGAAIIREQSVSCEVYNKCNRANYDIASIVGGFGMVCRYHDLINRVMDRVIKEKNGE